MKYLRSLYIQIHRYSVSGHFCALFTLENDFCFHVISTLEFLLYKIKWTIQTVMKDKITQPTITIKRPSAHKT